MKVFGILFSLTFLIHAECFSQNFKKKILQAYSLSSNNEFAQSNLILKEILTFKKDTGYKPGLAEFYIGRNFFSMNKMDSSIYWLGECLNPLENAKNYTCLSNAYAVLAAIELQYIKRTDMAILHYKQQAKFALLSNNMSVYYDGLTNIGATYRKLQKKDSAISYLNKVLKDTSQLNTSRDRASMAFGDMYLDDKNYQAAISIYQNAINNLRAPGQTIEKFMGLINLSVCYHALGLYGKQLSALREAESIQPPAVENAVLKELWGNMSQAYSQLFNYKEALKYQQKELTVTDSINVRNINDAMAEMETKFKVRQTQDSLIISQQELKLSEATTRDRERKFIFALIGAFGIGVTAFLFWRNASIRKKANIKLGKEKALVDALANGLNEANQTKSRLFSVIGHDLRSPISSLYAQLRMQELKGDNKDAQLSARIIPLLDTMEDLLVWSKSQMDKFSLVPVQIYILPLFEDLLNISSFKAESKNIKFEINIPFQVTVVSDENLLKTIYRNLITNAIQHGYVDSTIIVDYNKDNDTNIEIAISNVATLDNFQMLKAKWDAGNISSDFSGLGNVLIHEFAQKINMQISVQYKNDRIYIRTMLPQRLSSSAKEMVP